MSRKLTIAVTQMACTPDFQENRDRAEKLIRNAASKGALIAFSKSIAKEVASRNITVNSVAPGYIATDIVDVLSPEVRDLILNRIPQKRFGSSEDVANVIKFLASDDASYITGETIRVDGGIEL